VGRYHEARQSLNRIAQVNGLGKEVADRFVFPREKGNASYVEFEGEKGKAEEILVE
jgi:hypothetical protein